MALGGYEHLNDRVSIVYKGREAKAINTGRKKSRVKGEITPLMS